MTKDEKRAKSEVKKYYRDYFSGNKKIHYWKDVYFQNDFFGSNYRARLERTLTYLDDLNLANDAKILDLGCGAGILTREVTSREYKAYGMDYSYGMIQKAKFTCKNDRKISAMFLQGDIESIPFKDSMFDVVVCLGVITYLKFEELALQELERIIKPGGFLILSIVNKARLAKHLDFPVFIKNRLQKMLSNRITLFTKNNKANSRFFFKSYFIPRLRNSMIRQGFTVLDYSTVPLELLSFLGCEISPKRVNEKIVMSFEKVKNIPLFGSFGGMCIFKAQKTSLIRSSKK